MLDVSALITRFEDRFGGYGTEPRVFFCPGRINLIGEHIDYNGGFVFPAALTLGVYAVVRPRPDKTLRLYSENAGTEFTFDLNLTHTYDEPLNWANYPLGVLMHLRADGVPLQGYDIYYYGNLPQGAGLSSSAAIEVVTAYMVRTLNGETDIDRVALALFCQQVENQYINVNCGIMDQFAVALGKDENAILLNCQTLDYKYVRLDLAEFTLVVMDTHKPRELADSKYNERRAECNRALALINQDREHPYKDLCCIDPSSISVLQDDVLSRRARHVYEENQRVLQAIEVLNKGDMRAFGRLLTQSHQSLRDLYEVSSKELDILVSAAESHPGCVGARMTGAGFGGCALALVRTTSLEEFQEHVSKIYKYETDIRPSFYLSDIGDGVCEVTQLDFYRQ